MSLLRFLELPEPSSFLYKEEAAVYRSPFPSPYPGLDLGFDLLVAEERRGLGFPLGSGWPIFSPFDFGVQCRLPFTEFGCAAADLLRIERFVASPAAIRKPEAEACLRGLAERVEALEVGFAKAAAVGAGVVGRDRKYKWEAEVKGTKDGGRRWKYVAEAKTDGERKVKFEVGMGWETGEERRYAFEASSAFPGKVVEKKVKKNGKEKKEEKKEERRRRIVEITDPEPEQGAVVLRKAFAMGRLKGKRKILSPLDAALIIQMNFRAYLIRRSQVLRSLRALAVAKAKLKEIRALFSNFSYRRRIASDPEECQKFSEKIIVLLLTVDDIEGADYMVRAARKSMVEELEAMLDVVDPQPPGKLGSLRRRKFDLPEFSLFERDMSAEVAGVVELINQREGPSGA